MVPQRWLTHAYAKFNPRLEVGPIDERGYHPLTTTFQTLSLHDKISAQIAAHDSIEFIDGNVPAENTVTKALRFAREVATFPPLAISVAKHIPSEAGLGGGSSDAAALLRLIRTIAPGMMRATDAHEIAQAVGADVAFFLVGGRADASGYGEVLTPLPDPPEEHYVLIMPATVTCSTKEAYGRLDTLNWQRGTGQEPNRYYNDFERVAPCESLDLIERLQALGAEDAVLCGSGAAVLGRFQSEAEALDAAAQVDGWPVRSVPREESLRVWTEPIK